MKKQLSKICYVVCYRDPNYIRTRKIKAALQRLNGLQIYNAQNSRSDWLRYFETIGSLLKIRFSNNPDVYLLGFRGHEIFWLVRVITVGKRLVFDEFMSPTDALISERKLGFPGALLGYLTYPLEYFCLKFSRHCITDTYLHRDFISKYFAIAKEKIDVVYVGADDAEAGVDFVPRKILTNNVESLNVLFYGTFLPLHGMNIILEACKLMENKPIIFHIIGGQGMALAKFRKLHDKLKLRNVKHEAWVSFDKLRSVYIPNADLCLGGPFGGTPQAMRVITGKTYQFLAQQKPTVIGTVDEPVGFEHGKNCLLVDQGSAELLAEALDWAIINRSSLPAIGRNGYELYRDLFSTEALAEQLKPALGVD